MTCWRSTTEVTCEQLQLLLSHLDGHVPVLVHSSCVGVGFVVLVKSKVLIGEAILLNIDGIEVNGGDVHLVGVK